MISYLSLLCCHSGLGQDGFYCSGISFPRTLLPLLKKTHEIFFFKSKFKKKFLKCIKNFLKPHKDLMRLLQEDRPHGISCANHIQCPVRRELTTGVTRTWYCYYLNE